MSVAFVFPGQGGQFVGQGRPWAEADPAVKELFELADDICEKPISRLCFEGPAEELSKTENLQPAVLTVGLAALKMMRANKGRPAFVAGHSLGEFGALVAAEVFDEKTALKLVAKRAVIMAKAAEKSPGAMLAVIGLPAEELETICELARNEGPVVMANFNTPEQIVISGAARAVAAAGKYVKMKGGRGLPLPVSGAFHSELMAGAAELFAKELDKVEFNQPICPVLPNATAVAIEDAAEIKRLLKEQITSPVRWAQTVAALNAAGVSEYLEAWPKSYLGSMIKKSLPKDSAAVISHQS